jgi:hypothetical protein
MNTNKRQQDRVTLAMPRDLVRQARAAAIRAGTTLSAVTRRLLEEWLEGSARDPASGRD